MDYLKHIIPFVLIVDIIMERLAVYRGPLRWCIMLLNKRRGIRNGTWPVEIRVMRVEHFIPFMHGDCLALDVRLLVKESVEVGEIKLCSLKKYRLDSIPNSYGDDWQTPVGAQRNKATKLCFNFPSPKAGDKFVLRLETPEGECSSREYEITEEELKHYGD